MATKKRKGPMEKEMDRLSDLPDGLLHHILSFVNAKVGVQTCVLSKRWLRLWTSLPILIFHSDSFRTCAIFNKFVRRVLSGRRQRKPANLLGLKFHSNSTNHSILDRVIRYAASHSVQEINMKLRCCRPNDGLLISCVKLRRLRLEGCKISNNDLFSRFMNLETLTLDKCYISREEIRFKISVPRLVTLNITKLLRFPCGDRYKDEVVISCPRLSCFIYEGRCPTVFSMDGCPILDRVNIHLRRPISEKEMWEFPSSLKILLPEVVLHAKLLVSLIENGSIPLPKVLKVKTSLENDDMIYAEICNKATDETNELCWWGTKQDLDVFLAMILPRCEL